MGRPREFDEATAVTRAMEAFWETGYEATSTDTLIEAMGIGRGSLYNAYGSKAALYERALDAYCARDTEALGVRLEGEGPVAPAIREVLMALVEADLADPAGRGCLMINAAIERAGADAAIAHRVDRAFARIETAFAGALRRGVASGELAADLDCRAAARFLMTTIAGLRVVGKATADRRRLEDSVAMAMAALRRP